MGRGRTWIPLERNSQGWVESPVSKLLSHPRPLLPPWQSVGTGLSALSPRPEDVNRGTLLPFTEGTGGANRRAATRMNLAVTPDPGGTSPLVCFALTLGIAFTRGPGGELQRGHLSPAETPSSQLLQLTNFPNQIESSKGAAFPA